MKRTGSPVEAVTELSKNYQLILRLISREVLGRYKGSFIGLAWSFFNPVLMLAVYTFVFSGVFGARWGAKVDHSQFAIVLFSGLILFNIFAECLNKSPMVIVGNPNFVKKVVFPLEILPVVLMGSALFHAVVSFVVLLLAMIILGQYPSILILWAPIMILPLLFLSLGISWFLASVGVFIRDVAQAMALLSSVLMFLSPIFYPISAIPQQLRTLVLLNPLSFVIEQFRNVVILGVSPAWGLWSLYLLISLGIAFLGFAWFQKTRNGFADVI